MNKKFLFFALALILVLPQFVSAQFTPLPGDKRSKTDTAANWVRLNLSWNTGTNWDVYDTVAGFNNWKHANLNTTGMPTSGTRNTLIRGHHGDTVFINNGTITLNNLFIDSGAVFYARPTTQASAVGLRFGGNATLMNVWDSVTVVNKGRFGLNETHNLRFDINRDTAIYKFSGTSPFNITHIAYSGAKAGRLRVTFDNSFNIGLNVVQTSTTSLTPAFTNYANNSGRNGFNDSVAFTINPGKTVKLSDSSVWHMAVKTTSVNGGLYIYDIKGTLDAERSSRLSVLAPTDTTSSVLLVNVSGNLKFGKSQVIGDTLNSPDKGKVLLHVLAGGTVSALVDSSMVIYNNVVFNMMDSTATYRKVVAAADTLFPIAVSDTGNNSVILGNSGTVDTFSVRVRTGIPANWPAASAASLVNRVWTIMESNSGGSNLKVQLKWLTSGQLSGFNPANPISVYVFTGSYWKQDTATISGAGTRANPYVATITGVDSFRYFVIGNRNLPVAITGPATITSVSSLTPFTQILGTPSAAQTFTVSGINLGGNITVTPPSGYEVSVDNGTTWSSVSATLNQVSNAVGSASVMVRLNASSLGTFSGNVTLSSTGATTVNVPVTGTTLQPVVTSAGTLAAFSQVVGTPSATQTITTSGTSLTGDITVTPSFGYEVSVDNGATWSATAVTIAQTGGAVNNASIQVRLNAPNKGVYVGYIMLTSSGAATVYVPVTGTTSALGVQAFSKDEFSIYPNPATAQLNIRHLAARPGTEITIWQMDGRKVAAVLPVVNSNGTTVDISKLPAATYMVLFTSGKQQFSLKLTKN